MSPAGLSCIVGRDGIRPVGVLLEKKGKKPCSVGDVHPWIVESPDRAVEPYPTGRSGRNLHEADRRVVNSPFVASLSGVKSGLLRDDAGDEDRVNMVLAGNFCDGMGVGNRRREKVGTQTPSNRVVNHPVQCTTS